MLAGLGEPRGVGEIAGQGGDLGIAIMHLGIEIADAGFLLFNLFDGVEFLGTNGHQLVAEACPTRDAFGELVAIVLEIDGKTRILGGIGGSCHVLLGADFGHRQWHAGANAALGQADHAPVDDRRDDQRDESGSQKTQRK